MSKRVRTLVSSAVLCGAGFAAALLVMRPIDAADPEPARLKTQVVAWDDAPSHKADWGEIRTYFRGETPGTKNVLTAVAVVEPGKSVHPAHRHAEEEYLVIARGSGTWSVDGKESPAKLGDILYVEPWVYHGVTNTGDEPLIFVVFRYNPKGTEIPPRPDDQPDEKE